MSRRGPHRGAECPLNAGLDPGQLGAGRCDCPPNPGVGVRPAGYLVHATPARHVCPVPMAGPDHYQRPPVPAGVAWRCTCGRLWEVEDAPQPTRGQVLVDARRWRPARLITRWRDRRGRLIEYVPLPELGPPAGGSGASRSTGGEA